MARGTAQDERQADLFGSPQPAPAASKAPRRRIREVPGQPQRPPMNAEADKLNARPTQRDLDELVADLPDEQLAHLVVATIRALKRRLTRSTYGPDRTKARTNPLERAARQLAEELRHDMAGEYDE